MRILRVLAAAPVLLGALALAGAPAMAQVEAPEQKPPSQQERIAGEIDRYLQSPRSAATYRALANMGDPAFLAEDRPYESSWDSPLLEALDMKWTDCRWAYSDQVYRKRLRQFGANHPYVGQWLGVQRAVFSRCHGYEQQAGDPIPAAMASGDERIVRLQAEDRAYQKAAALFYEGRMSEARAGFAGIAARPGEHQAAAKLMVASIDAGSKPSGYEPANASPAVIARAERLITDPAAKPMQANAHELVGWIGASADTREGRRAQVKVTLEALALPLATIRADEQAAARYQRSAEDLSRLFTDFDDDGWWVTGAVPKGYFGSLAMAEAAKTNPIAAFALTQRPDASAAESYQAAASTDAQHKAWEEYNADRPDRDAWRVVLLQIGTYYDWKGTSWAEVDALLPRVAARPTDHDVALLGFLFDHMLRQSLDGGLYSYDELENRNQRAVAITRLAAYPYKQSQHFRSLYSKALNTFIGHKEIESARRLRDLVEPQLEDEFGYSWLVNGDLMLLLAEDEAAMIKAINDHDASRSTLLNRLPARQLARLAADGRIDAKIRKRFARVAWTRDYVLGRKIPRELDATMRALNPDLAAKWRSKPGAQPRDHELLLDVINTPGMNLRIESRPEPDGDPFEIDVYEHSLNNWWCAPDATEQNEREEDALASSVDKIGRGTLETLLAKSFLWQSIDREERQALSAIPNGAKFLGEAAIAWGRKASAKKPRGADEALALAVRTTRYGCQFNGSHGAYSKAAWDLLHRKFPGGSAARRTRWWFDCKHFTYGCTDSSKDDQPFGSIEAYEKYEAEQKREEEEAAAEYQRQLDESKTSAPEPTPPDQSPM